VAWVAALIVILLLYVLWWCCVVCWCCMCRPAFLRKWEKCCLNHPKPSISSLQPPDTRCVFCWNVRQQCRGEKENPLGFD
jgi:hypothetical protein